LTSQQALWNRRKRQGAIQRVQLRQPRPRPLLGWLWQVSLAGLVNFRVAFGNYRNGHLPRNNWAFRNQGSFRAVLALLLGNPLGLLFFRLRPSSAPPPNHLVPVFSCEKALNIKIYKEK
jgi:hypothetical protein